MTIVRSTLVLLALLVSGCNGDPAALVQPTNLARHTRAESALSTTGVPIRDLGTFGGTWSAATGINAAGSVVGQIGSANGEVHAFHWTRSSFTNLTPSGATHSSAQGIDNSNSVAVLARGDAWTRAFIWADGAITDLDIPNVSYVADLSEAGDVVGWRRNGVRRDQAFQWRDGALTDLPSLGGLSSLAFAVNGQGVVAGRAENSARQYKAVVWKDGAVTDLGALVPEAGAGTGILSGAPGLNAAGDVAGFSRAPDGTTHAVLWSRGEIIDLGNFGGYFAVAFDVNERRQVVGYAIMRSTFIRKAFLWDNGRVVELGALAPGGSGFGTFAYAINNRGEIAGQANGQAVIWTYSSPKGAP